MATPQRTAAPAVPPHVLPDVLREGLRIVFCGSAAGRRSAELGAYYAGPGNRFWPTLYAVGLTPRLLRPEEFPLLPDFGLGLTDLCKTALGADQALPAAADDPAALRRKIARYRPAVLAFVGKRPAAVTLGRRVDYGAQAERIGVTALFVLPSPSGAARRYWDEEPWRALGLAAG
ncbi:MAG: mismatch-specific DNA-glycosylase [Kiloniellales bacterium]